MYERIIELEKLTCTSQEFEVYINTIDLSEVEAQLLSIQPTVHTFDEKYNWVEIQNPANGELYYTVKVWWRTFLQNIVPYVSWNLPLTKKNIDNIFLSHKEQLTSDYIFEEKIRLAVQHFKK